MAFSLAIAPSRALKSAGANVQVIATGSELCLAMLTSQSARGGHVQLAGAQFLK